MSLEPLLRVELSNAHATRVGGSPEREAWWPTWDSNPDLAGFRPVSSTVGIVGRTYPPADSNRERTGSEPASSANWDRRAWWRGRESNPQSFACRASASRSASSPRWWRDRVLPPAWSAYEAVLSTCSPALRVTGGSRTLADRATSCRDTASLRPQYVERDSNPHNAGCKPGVLPLNYPRRNWLCSYPLKGTLTVAI